MERSSIGCKKALNSAPRIIFDKFSVFFDSVYYKPNFYFYWSNLLFKSTHMNSASSARLPESFEIIVFIWNDLVLGAKTFKECTPNHFWQVFSFFDSVYYRPNFHFYWPVSLFRTIFYWLPKVPNSTPRIIFYKFSVFLTQFTIGQTFNSTGRLFCLNRLICAVPPLQG